MMCVMTSIWLGLLLAFLLGILVGWWIFGCCWKKKYLALKDKQDHAPVNSMTSKSAAVSSFSERSTPKNIPAGIKLNDLKIVEGIGPKISEILRDNGIKTWWDLADTKPETIKEYLKAAGSRFQMANPGSWPKQAKMAAQGKFDELQKWQDAHDHGIES